MHHSVHWVLDTFILLPQGEPEVRKVSVTFIGRFGSNSSAFGVYRATRTSLKCAYTRGGASVPKCPYPAKISIYF